jgi:hypothetical protein
MREKTENGRRKKERREGVGKTLKRGTNNFKLSRLKEYFIKHIEKDKCSRSRGRGR